MTPTQILSGPNYARLADATVSPPHDLTVWKGGASEWNPIKFSVERHTNFLIAERESIAQLRDKKVLFLYSDYLDSFFERILPHLPDPVVLIVHGDRGIGPEHFGYLASDRIGAVFATNCTIAHHKLMPIPLGVPHGQIDDLLAVMGSRLPVVYNGKFAEFGLSTNRRRPAIMERLKTRGDVTTGSEHTCPFNYYLRMTRHEWVISPPGAGPDCFRTWEALYLRRVPVVERWETGNPYYNFPVVRVDDIGNPPLIIPKLSDLILPLFSAVKLEIEYWRRQVAIAVHLL